MLDKAGARRQIPQLLDHRLVLQHVVKLGIAIVELVIDLVGRHCLRENEKAGRIAVHVAGVSAGRTGRGFTQLLRQNEPVAPWRQHHRAGP